MSSLFFGKIAVTEVPFDQSGEAVDEFRQAAFQVGCLVAVNAAAFCQPVYHADNFRQELNSL